MSAADVAAADLSAAGLLAVATGAAREAGELLALPGGRVSVAATKSSPTNVVTEMDRRSEELIRARILAGRPGDAILGEEGGQTGDTAGAPVRWVIDPLDGTVNYLYGLPDWAVSIAAEVAGEVVAGAVFVPSRGELFTATRGGGGWLESAGRTGRTGRTGPAALPSRRAARPGAGGDGLRVPGGAAEGPGRGRRRAAAPGAGHQAGRGGVGRPVLGGRRPAGRVLRAGPELLGLRRGRADRGRGGGGRRRAARRAA